MAIQAPEPGRGRVECRECGGQMRRTDMSRQGDRLMMHLECANCGHTMDEPLSWRVPEPWPFKRLTPASRPGARSVGT